MAVEEHIMQMSQIVYIVAWNIGCRKGIEGGDVGEDDVQEGQEDDVQ